MSGFLLGLLVGAWAGFLFGLLFLAAWINIKRFDAASDREDVDFCDECGSWTTGGVTLHQRGCRKASPVRQAFL